MSCSSPIRNSIKRNDDDGQPHATPEDFAKVGRLMAEGKITADMMLTHRYPFATLAETYERDVINNRELIKGVITF